MEHCWPLYYVYILEANTVLIIDLYVPASDIFCINESFTFLWVHLYEWSIEYHVFYLFEKNQVYTVDCLNVIIKAITDEAMFSFKPYGIFFLKRRQDDGNSKHYVIISDILRSDILRSGI